MAKISKTAQRQKKNKRIQIAARVMAIGMIIIMVLFAVIGSAGFFL